MPLGAYLMNLLRFLFKSDLRIFSLVFIAIMLATVIQVMRQPRMYEATGSLRLYRVVTENPVARDSLPASTENVPELQATLKSAVFAQRVAKRMSDADRAAFLRPYANLADEADDALIERLLRENLGCSLNREKLTVTIQYPHPDRLVCARVTDLFIDEYIAYQARRRIDEAMQAVEGLKLRAEQQQRHVQKLTKEIAIYREQRAENTGMVFESDAGFEALQQKQAKEQNLLDALTRRMRDTTMAVGMETQGWRVVDRAVPANEDDYLIAPMVRRVAWGFAVAVVGGLLAVGVVNIFSRGRGPEDNPPVVS